MKPLDRLIFGIIAVSLALIAARPFYADALGHRDLANVNIAAVAGKRLGYGDPLPVK